MPLRKSGAIIGTTLTALTLSATVAPAAHAGGLFSLLSAFSSAASGKVTTKTTAPTTKVSAAQVTTTAAATTAVGAPVASSAVPSGSCTPLPTAKSFHGVDGDDSDYSLAPNGDFENGTGGWTLSGGARIVAGNETLGVTAGRKALQLPLSASATSPSFCVDQNQPHFRFAYKVDNAVLAGFIAYVIYRDSAGKITNVELVSSKALALAPSTWQASPKSPLATIIPLNATTKTASVQLKITSLNPTDFVQDTADAIIGENIATKTVTRVGGLASNLVASITGALSPVTNIGVTIDSVMVDPYRRG